MAEAAARGVDASAASVSIRFPDGSQRLVWWPNEVANATAAARLPVAYRGNEVGELTVVKPAGQQLSRAESRLLADLSSQAGLVLHNLRLTDELEARLAEVSSQAAEIRASRQRLVSVADTERQRLVETIQRGPESQLKTLAIELAGIEGRVTSHPLEASERLDQLTNDAQNSLDKLRQVARGVYPALLRDKGLLPALRSEVAREAKAITISAEGLGRYPLNVEGVVFFSCQEVLRRTENVSEIALHDGRGMIEFSVAAPHAELASMVDALEDRIEAMGGGIAVVGDRLVGRIPAQAAETIA
jgi:signal transduction histidine kinase